MIFRASRVVQFLKISHPRTGFFGCSGFALCLKPALNRSFGGAGFFSRFWVVRAKQDHLDKPFANFAPVSILRAMFLAKYDKLHCCGAFVDILAAGAACANELLAKLRFVQMNAFVDFYFAHRIILTEMQATPIDPQAFRQKDTLSASRGNKKHCVINTAAKACGVALPNVSWRGG